jgi:predicted nucleotidyltransferase
MISDLAKLMETISMLQSEPTPKPVIEIEKPTMHPLLQAMQELKEDGVVESVDAHTIYSNVQSGHREPDDFVEGDIGDRIYWFDDYKLSSLPISNLNLDEHYVDEDLVDDYIEHIKYSPKTMPPIVYDPIAKSIIDGIHRANAYAKLGYENIPAYVGLTKSDSYGERESDNIEEEIAYHGTTDDIAEFYPLTHFGTEKAAKDRMTYKKIKDGKIYKVDLNIKNPLTIKDFPGIHYDRLYAFELRDKKLISQKEMEAITTIDDKAELRKALLTKLKELGIDGFVYKNKYEDKGNISYVIVDPNQVKVLSVEPATEEVTEASPNTLEGSFTPDLVESKTWLAEMLAKGLKGKNAGTIYVLGSWYGNMGIFLQQAGVKFDKLVLIEPNEKWLMHSKELLDTLNDEGKLVLIHQKAEDAVYEKPGVVINTSCNETGPVFLTKLPDNMLCLLQARNNNETTLFPTEQMEDFVDYFPLQKVYYTGKKSLEDPEVNYVRYMKIGRTGKTLDEAITTGQGGGSAGVGGGQMVGGPTTYEQEYDMFKSKGPRRITAMTNESEKSFPNIVDTIVKNIPNVNEIYFHGSRAIGKGKRKSDWDILVIVDDSVVGRDYINTVFALQDIAKEFKNFDIQPSKANNHISRIAKEEGKLLYSANQKIDEALDSSYPYDGNAISGKYTFETEDGVSYKVYFQGKDLVEVAFSAVLPGEEENFRPDKVSLTGTGNSRKVFGTVIEIVNDYTNKNKPNAIYFTADSNEPSRIKLYDAMILQVSKALPDYYADRTIDLSSGKAYLLKRKDTNVNEALDSSYPYRNSKQNPGKDFYFDTEDGQEYKVEFDSIWGDDVSVAFSARGQGDEHKTGITGTGNSRKIFGTVIKIVKDYIRKANPEIIAFSANNSEPSRVRLYNMLASQVNKELPNYNFTDAFSNGGFTTYYLTRDGAKIPTSTKVKAKAGKALDAVFEEEL